MDRDEPRFAQATRQMLDAGGWEAYAAPRVQDRLRLSKPPLVYWMQAASVRTVEAVAPDAQPAARAAIWAYRLPSVLAALLASLLTAALAARMFAPGCALPAALLLASCPIILVDARLARADQLLLLCVVAMQLGLWHVWRAGRRPAAPLGWCLLFWAALALGMLTKGPIAPMIAALTCVALSATTGAWSWLSRTRPLLGLAICGALIAPWLLMAARAVGVAPLLEAVYDEVLIRSVDAKEGHWGPPGYYLLLTPLLFWPGSLLLAPTLRRSLRTGLRWSSVQPAPPPHAPRGWRLPSAGRSAELFCLAWLLPSWLLFELAGTKLPHYILPLLPALALLSARTLMSLQAAPLKRWLTPLEQRWGFAAWMTLSVLVVAAPLIVTLALRGAAGLALLAAGSALACGLLLLLTWQAWHRASAVAALRWSLAAAGVNAIALFGLVLPRSDALWLSQAAVRAAAQADAGGAAPLAAAGYHEDSVVFLRGGRVQLMSQWELASWLAENPGGLAITPETDYLDHLPVRKLWAQTGFNYNAGRWVRLVLVSADVVGP